MGWFRVAVAAWLMSSALIGVAMTIVTTARFNSVQERILGAVAASAGAAVLSALPALVAAAVIYGPLRTSISATGTRTLLIMMTAAFVVFVGLAIKLRSTIGDAEYSVVFWMWVAALAGSFLAVEAFQTSLSRS